MTISSIKHIENDQSKNSEFPPETLLFGVRTNNHTQEHRIAVPNIRHILTSNSEPNSSGEPYRQAAQTISFLISQIMQIKRNEFEELDIHFTEENYTLSATVLVAFSLQDLYHQRELTKKNYQRKCVKEIKKWRQDYPNALTPSAERCLAYFATSLVSSQTKKPACDFNQKLFSITLTPESCHPLSK